MIKVFFIADTHFNHKKIIEYENRPFQDIEEMNNKMIENWNSVVGRMDKVFMLGDFGFYDTSRLLDKLKGFKILVMGNHDRRKSVKHWFESGFTEVSKYPILYNNWLLSHEPVGTTIYKNIYGHLHSKGWNNEYRFCVSAEKINYTPINIEEIEKYFKEFEL